MSMDSDQQRSLEDYFAQVRQAVEDKNWQLAGEVVAEAAHKGYDVSEMDKFVKENIPTE